MLKWNWKRLSVAAGLSLTLVAAGCGSGTEEGTSGNASVGETVDYTITGIDAGAGVVKSSEKAIEEYGLEDWEVKTSSGGAMTEELGNAIEDEEPIIVTGWTPHWKFAKYDLKYLEDPKGVFGDEEQIKTMVRQGVKEEKPNFHKILDQFAWTTDEMEQVMLSVSDGEDIETAAKQWVDDNEDKVAEWTKGTEKVDGIEVELVYVAWDSEIASTNVIAEVLRRQGFAVKITQVENAMMWKAVAEGEADGMVAAWLPGTHGDLYESYKDQVEDLGANLEGAKIGLVVPKYMDVTSIEDLK
ncbi:glycine betaine ABC transporter substrate-binding protein [Pontibacillus litoralis]|uniref:Glycine/betaine ABC transporter n=1 Tax=Pontibacillus litoralis JSM 072002 TaxID=1385512 RepID=A0A0A5HNQ0_9BACI|nr:glycine betaine ABC transporter substrate-binding protein [Pontibacillus litoralis]KGX85267.1 glycine/betaine ABC transporter [Pontibacillus litoralis JSM 072002]